MPKLIISIDENTKQYLQRASATVSLRSGIRSTMSDIVRASINMLAETNESAMVAYVVSNQLEKKGDD